MWIRNRLYTIHKALAPSREWEPYAATNSYPFSIKPEKKISVQDVMALIREYNKGSVFDMSGLPAWLIAGKEGKMEKKPLTTPFPTKRQAKLLKIPTPASACTAAPAGLPGKRPTRARGGRHVVRLRPARPYPLRARLHRNEDTKGDPGKSNFDRDLFSFDSAQWAFMLQDGVVNWRYQEGHRGPQGRS
ncbi:hypothetical protein MASR2M79_11070 [Aminivibrio sp.]